MYFYEEGNALVEGTLKIACAQEYVTCIYAIRFNWVKYGVCVQAIKVLTNLMNAWRPKT